MLYVPHAVFNFFGTAAILTLSLVDNQVHAYFMLSDSTAEPYSMFYTKLFMAITGLACFNDYVRITNARNDWELLSTVAN